MGRLGRWILRLAPFKFRVRHTRGVDNVVADALSRMFEGDRGENPEAMCAGLIQSLPLVYSSLEEHQKGDPGVARFWIANGLTRARAENFRFAATC